MFTRRKILRIIHCADIHLDSKMQTNLSKEKAKERKNELLITFSDMVDYALKNDVKVILIAGDLFDTVNIARKVKNKVRDLIISTPEIDFIYLKGNHDKNNFLEDMELIPENLKMFNDEWTEYKYDNVVIAGVELNSKNSSTIYEKLSLDSNTINIVTLHGQESKANVKDKTEIINLKKLKNKNIDYLALGHIHTYKKEKLDARGVYCYSGCLEGRGFDECGEKGFVLLNIDNEKKEIASEFIPFTKRTLHEIHIDITGISNTKEIEKKLDRSLEDIPEKDLVKVVIEGQKEIDTEIDLDYLLKKYGSFYFIKMNDDTRVKINYEDYKNDISLKGEFIRMVIDEKMEEKEMKEIIEAGIKALSGDEVD